VVETPIDDTSERQDVSISTDLLTRSLWAKPMRNDQMSMDVSSSASNAADKVSLAKFAGNPIDKAQQKCHVLVVPQHFDFDAPFQRRRRIRAGVLLLVLSFRLQRRQDNQPHD